MASPEAVARSYLQSFATANPAEIAAHVSEGFVNEQVAALGTGCVSRAQYQQRLVGFLAEMADISYEVEDLVADGARVAVFYRLQANWKGHSGEEQRPIQVRGVQRLLIQGGLITHRTDYWDSAAFLAQADPVAKEALANFGITFEPE